MCNKSGKLYTLPSTLYLYQNNLHQGHINLDRPLPERPINIDTTTTTTIVLDLSQSRLYQRRMLALAQRQAQAQDQI